MRPLGLRGRLVATLIAVVALTVLVVGVTSVFLVDRSLRNRLVDEVIAQSESIEQDGIRSFADSNGLTLEQCFETLMTGLAVRYYKAVAG